VSAKASNGVTAPALIWRPFDRNKSSALCTYDGCDRPPTMMRGPRSPMIRLPWRAYCTTHAVLAGFPRQRWRQL